MRKSKGSKVELINKLDLRDFTKQLLPEELLNETFKSMSDFTCTIESSKTIDPADLDACFRLIEATSKESYATSSFGWHPTAKKREMKLPDMRYLLVRGKRNVAIVGFASFMLTFEDGLEVIYLYEIHLSEACRGLGLGKRLVNSVQSVGQQAEMKKVMLTILESNTAARSFYEQGGFVLDDFSPGPRKLRNGTIKYSDYAILSKTLVPKEMSLD